jgi:glycosyltransferase involved in cell wall biosynthesis
MCATDVILLASLSTRSSIEQYGRVIPEAMACGALAIVSDCGAPKELVGDCGIVLPEGDVDELTTAISEIVLNPKTFAIQRVSGAKRATTQYSVSRQADIYMAALQDAVRTAG